MRLINVETLYMQEFFGDVTPPYAILSHTWGPEEVTFEDCVQGSGQAKSGYLKISYCTQQARRDGLKFIWMDTCCIDKKSSAELSEAVNSMFRWYRDAKKCYAYLSDVSAYQAAGEANDDPLIIRASDLSTTEYYIEDAKPEHDLSTRAFEESRWFTRGWTLQELLAPAEVNFYCREWQLLGTRKTLLRDIQQITGLPAAALQGRPLSEFSIGERIAWTTRRETTRPEDAAYCLLGIFDISMPLLYGEGGEKAFRRLYQEISNHEAIDNAKFKRSSQPETQKRGRKPIPKFLESLQPVSENGSSLLITDQTEFVPPTSFYDVQLFDSHFRILVLDPGVIGKNITGNIEEYDLSNPPPYYCLSYVWGHEPALHPITVNGCQVLIRSNLFHALQRIRLRSGPVHIWIDAICINQQDENERNSQVRQMANIYRSAIGVFIWLGEEDSTSKFAMDLIDLAIQTDYPWSSPWWEEYGFTALAQLLDRPWFRRGWVLQEAAFSANSTIYCGDRQVYMDSFTMAVDLIRAVLSTTTNMNGTPPLHHLSNFRDSPAVRLLDTIKNAFHRAEDGSILHHRLSLETLVDLGRCTETADDRDTIYALLNLASDQAFALGAEETDSICADYSKRLLDVYVDFIQHCIRRSRSLNIIVRPWAPVPMSTRYEYSQQRLDGANPHLLPSWITTRDKLPFGNPALRLNHRLHGNPLVGSSQKQIYHCHDNTKPRVRFGQQTDSKECNGSLFVTGIVLGTVAKTSTRMADAIITKECLEILGAISRNPYSKLLTLPDAMWRTLCADRDDKGDSAPPVYRSAMLHLLQLSSDAPRPDDTANLLNHISSIDIEELLTTEVPDHVRKFLEVCRNVVWNRRTFRAEPTLISWDARRPLVGLVPQGAKVGDRICILYGCSVPVVLRRKPLPDGNCYWQLIGDAYVDGIMDGEAIQFSARAIYDCHVEFDVR